MKTVKIEVGEVLGREVSTVDLMKILLDVAPPNGFKRSDYKMCDAIENQMMDAVDDGKESFELDEDQFKYLCGIIDGGKWGTRAEIVRNFVQQFTINPANL